MSRYRHALPQLEDRLFLTDAGLETTLVFLDGRELPCFAAFDLLRDPGGADRLLSYYAQYARIAQDRQCGFILEAPTWRANADWGARLGYDAAALAEANARCIELLEEVRAEYERPSSPIVISGCLGPRGDGYRADARMSADEAAAYHRPQIETFARTSADMLCAMTLGYAEEAIGIAQAAAAAGIPVAISFTTETDGRLPCGARLQDAIEAVDAAVDPAPAYYMINCAHPDHFSDALEGVWIERLRGVRANASRRSHAELDEAEHLDDGDPVELGELYRRLRQRCPRLTILGGCCGTDHRHIEAIGLSCCP